MDLAVLKTTLSDFSTFVDGVLGLVKNVPTALQTLAGLLQLKPESFNFGSSEVLSSK